MKKLFLFLTVLFPLMANAASVAVVIDGVAYSYDDSWLYALNKDVQVVSLSDGAKYSGDVVIKDSIECQIRDEKWEYVTRKLPVTVIGGSAFRDCPDLKSVTIPKTITSIVEYAFLGTCTNINILDLESWTSITLGGWTIKTGQRDKYLPAFPEGFNLYLNGKEAKDLEIPASVKTVGEYQFYKCQNITSVNVNAQKVLSYAFSQCPNLTTVNIGGNVETIYSTVFMGNSLVSTVTVEEGKLQSITGFAFCKSLKSVKLPNSLKKIDAEAFWLSGLEHIDIPEGVEILGNGAFAATMIESITLPSSLTKIGDNAFAYCEKLKSVTFSDGLEVIGYKAFENTALTAVEIPSSVKSIGMSAFQNCKNLTTLGFVGCHNIKVGTRAFWDCTNISYLYTDNLDAWCSSMDFSSDSPVKSTKRLYVNGKVIDEHVVCPNVSRIIGNLSYCNDITTITFLENVQDIRPNAFYNCPNLKTIFCYAKTPPTFSNETFGNRFNNVTVYVPKDLVETYRNYVQTSYWVNWKDCCQILPIEDDPMGIESISDNIFSIDQQNGAIIIGNAPDGVLIKAFSPSGTLVASSVVSNGVATLNLQEKNAIVLLKIEDKTWKIRVK